MIPRNIDSLAWRWCAIVVLIIALGSCTKKTGTGSFSITNRSDAPVAFAVAFPYQTDRYGPIPSRQVYKGTILPHSTWRSTVPYSSVEDVRDIVMYNASFMFLCAWRHPDGTTAHCEWYIARSEYDAGKETAVVINNDVEHNCDKLIALSSLQVEKPTSYNSELEELRGFLFGRWPGH